MLRLIAFISNVPRWPPSSRLIDIHLSSTVAERDLDVDVDA
jgi:hypothetical protein